MALDLVSFPCVVVYFNSCGEKKARPENQFVFLFFASISLSRNRA